MSNKKAKNNKGEQVVVAEQKNKIQLAKQGGGGGGNSNFNSEKERAEVDYFDLPEYIKANVGLAKKLTKYDKAGAFLALINKNTGALLDIFVKTGNPEHPAIMPRGCFIPKGSTKHAIAVSLPTKPYAMASEEEVARFNTKYNDTMVKIEDAFEDILMEEEGWRSFGIFNEKPDRKGLFERWRRWSQPQKPQDATDDSWKENNANFKGSVKIENLTLESGRLKTIKCTELKNGKPTFIIYPPTSSKCLKTCEEMDCLCEGMVKFMLNRFALGDGKFGLQFYAVEATVKKLPRNSAERLPEGCAYGSDDEDEGIPADSKKRRQEELEGMSPEEIRRIVDGEFEQPEFE